MTDTNKDKNENLADDSALANLSHDHERLRERFQELKSKHKKQDFLNTYLILLLFVLFIAKGYHQAITVFISTSGSILYLITMAKWYKFRGIADKLEKWHDLLFDKCRGCTAAAPKAESEEEFEPRPGETSKGSTSH